jgi:hypothetical protein
MLGGTGRSQRGKEMQVCYHRMTDGTIDTTGGRQEGNTLAAQRNHLSVKYDTQVRFLLGTASVLLPDGTVEGWRCEALKYTARFVLTDKDLEVRIKTEIAHVKTLEGDRTPWVTGNRIAEDGLFDEDPLTMLVGAGEATAAILLEWEVVLVNHVACLEGTDVEILVKEKGLGEVRLRRMRTEARTAHPGKFDRAMVNHTTAANPYESLYWNHWLQVIKITYIMKCISVQDLVMHMTVESDEIMRGTQHKDEAMFKHDALSLMTAGKTVKWMKATIVNEWTIYSRWLLSEVGLNNEITTYGKMTTHYQGWPSGNLLRLTSLDKFANKNLMDCVNAHVLATQRMFNGLDVNMDPTFDLCDTVRASRALLRCWDPVHGPNSGAPTSATTNAVHMRIWGKHLGKIRMAGGRAVGSRVGHCRAEEAMQRGGEREQGLAPYLGEGAWLHADAHLGQDIKVELCVAMACNGTA